MKGERKRELKALIYSSREKIFFRFKEMFLCYMVEEKISLILTLFFKIKSNLCDLKKLCSDPRNDVQIIIMI